MIGSKALHHFHLRKRIHLENQPYPHPDKWKNFLDRIIYVVGISGPIMTIPQLYKIWIEQNANGVSFISWTSYLVTSIFWLMYGLTHKEKPIIVTNICWVIINTLIIIGIIFYG